MNAQKAKAEAERLHKVSATFEGLLMSKCFQFPVKKDAHDMGMFCNDCNVLQERLARIEQDIREEETRQRQEAKFKRDQIDRAERNRNAPVDDSQMVDEMFGFIDAQTDSSGEGAAPTAFKV